MDEKGGRVGPRASCVVEDTLEVFRVVDSGSESSLDCVFWPKSEQNQPL